MQEHSLPYRDETDESVIYVTLSGKTKRDDEENVCWLILGQTDPEETWELCLSNQYLWQLTSLPHAYLSIHILSW